MSRTGQPRLAVVPAGARPRPRHSAESADAEREQAERLAAALPEGPALLHDGAGVVVAATAALARLAGRERSEELVGRAVTEVLVLDPTDAGGGHVRRGAAEPLPVRVVRWPTVPGTACSALAVVDLAAPAAADADCLDPGPLSTSGDAGTAGTAMARLRPGAAAERRRLDDLQRIAGIGCWEYDVADGVWSISPALREMLGLRVSDADGGPVRRGTLVPVVHPDDRERVAGRWDALLSADLLLDVDFRSADGSGRHFHARGARVADRGRAGVVVGAVEDVTERRTAELRMRASTQRFTDLLAVAPVGIAMFDDDERLIKANQALCRLLGQGPEALRGRRADDLLDLDAERAGDDDPRGASGVRSGVPLLGRPADAAGSVSWSCPARALRTRERGAGGAVTDAVWCELHVSVSVRDDGSATHLVVFTDVTSTRQVEASLRHQAMHDELTGLPNRRALAITVERLLDGPTARRTAVLFCDLDNFKRVNDSLGHDAGDELLVELAGRLRRALPAGCAATRISGDEFVVVCADVDRHGGLDALSRSVSAILRTAVPVHGQLVRVSATVGAAVGATVGIANGTGLVPALDPGEDPVAQVLRHAPGDLLARADTVASAVTLDPSSRSEEVETISRGHTGGQDLLRFADAALFEAKSAGTGRFALADEAIMRGADEALRMETQLREAMANDELVLHFQPVVGADGTVQTAEALVRWQHPERGLLTPDKFLPIAEAADLMGDLDRWVLRSAVREAATWPAPAGGRAASVAVNLAGLLPGDPDFLPTVRAIVADAGLPWDRLVLELVETCLADLPAHTLREMNELIAAGVRFAVDDFGTGYSSLSRLTGLPAQIVKLDRGFVRGVATGESDRAVARAVVDLTAAIGQVCVAEGVENNDQFEVLRDLGVHAYQGWLFARAMPPEALLELLGGGPLSPDAAAG